jgi:hypothetical protein
MRPNQAALAPREHLESQFGTGSRGGTYPGRTLGRELFTESPSARFAIVHAVVRIHGRHTRLIVIGWWGSCAECEKHAC